MSKRWRKTKKNEWQALVTCFNFYEHGHIASDCLHPRRRGGERYPILRPQQPDQKAKERTTEVRREVELARHEVDRRPAKAGKITLIGVSTSADEAEILANKRMHESQEE